MTDSGGLQHSLAVMGFAELGLAFVALGCYSLVLNGSLGARGRLVAMGCATFAAAVFAALTDPWVHGVILVALGVGAMGIFVALAWAFSAVCGLTARARALEPATSTADDAPQGSAAQLPHTGHAPIHSS